MANTRANNTDFFETSDETIPQSIIEELHYNYMEKWKSPAIQNLSREQRWAFVERQQHQMYLQVFKIFPTVFVPGWFSKPDEMQQMSSKTIVLFHHPCKYDQERMQGLRYGNEEGRKEKFEYLEIFYRLLEGAPSREQAEEELLEEHVSWSPLIPPTYYVAFLYPFQMPFGSSSEIENKKRQIESLGRMFGTYIKHKALVCGAKLIIGVGTTLIYGFFKNIARCPEERNDVKTKYCRQPHVFTLKGAEKKSAKSKPGTGEQRVTCALFYCPHPFSFLASQRDMEKESVELTTDEHTKKQQLRNHEQDLFVSLLGALTRFYNPLEKFKGATLMRVTTTTENYDGRERLDVTRTLEKNLEKTMKQEEKEKQKKQKKKVAEQEKKKKREEMMKRKRETQDEQSQQDATKRAKIDDTTVEKKNAFSILLQTVKNNKSIFSKMKSKK